MGPSFPARLNRLFELVHPLGCGPFSSSEVADAITATTTTVSISRPYMSQLRTGQRSAPSPKVVAALADFFRVRPQFFTDDHYYTRIERELAATVSVESEQVREIARRAAELSLHSRNELLAFVEQLWQREHRGDP